MTVSKFGTATEAAGVLGRSLSQFNEIRRRDTHAWDAQAGKLRKLRRGEAARPESRDLHLVAPSLAGQRFPGSAWEFDLERLRRIREGHLSAARLPDQHSE